MKLKKEKKFCVRLIRNDKRLPNFHRLPSFHSCNTGSWILFLDRVFYLEEEMTHEQAIEKAKDLAIWATGGVIQFQGEPKEVIEAWIKCFAKALLTVFKREELRGIGQAE